MSGESRVPINSDADIVAARQRARAMADEIGFWGTDLVVIATAISELARNIVEYAGRGEIVIEALQNGTRQGILVIAHDNGPGIADIPLAMRPGYSSRQSLGMGLPGAKRLMDEFEIVSEVGRGDHRHTSQVDSVNPMDKDVCEGIDILACGVAAKALEGESESGDVHFVKATRDGALVAVLDGLGHGQHAAAAAQRAIATLAANADKSVIAIVNECHTALRGTRGVVMSLASFNANENTMTWIGVGNIEGRLLRADVDGTSTHESLVQRGGVVGYQLPSLRAMVVSVAVGDTLLLFTDGIQSGFTVVLPVHDRPQKVAEHILMQHRRGTDDALVLVARYLGKSN